jgi:Flp pilus assembly protein TadG
MSRFRHPDRSAGSSRGVAAIEFALVAPFVMLVMLAGADLSLFMRTMTRMDETAAELAKAVTQYDNLYVSDFVGLFGASQTIAGPQTDVTGIAGATIITGIVRVGTNNQTIAWQRRTGLTTFTSMLGAVNAVPVLPDNYALPAGGTLIAVEVFTNETLWVFSAKLPLMSDVTNIASIRSYALFQPRLGALSTINPGNRPP